jgi:serine/threonine protein phosphatase PrpC
VLRAAGTSVIGPEHEGNGQSNQDALSLRGWRGGWIAAVADGLGSRQFSSVGSRAAVQAAQRTIRTLVPPTALHDLDARETATRMYRQWLQAVPYVDKSSAASTILLAACDVYGRARVWQLGDGLIACRSKGQIRVVTPGRAGFGNETRALGVHRAWSDWTWADVVLDEEHDAVVLMTDGVSDDLNANTLEDFVATLVAELSAKSRRSGRTWLKRELSQWSTPSHSDDKTIAIIYRS